MSNLATVTPIRPSLAVVERQVADLDDGFIMIAMQLYEELIGANLTRNQAKVAHAVCRKTYGFKKKMDRIADSQLAELARISRSKANIAKNELISMKVLISENGMIGPNKNIQEWKIPTCSQIGNIVSKAGTKNVSKQGTVSVSKTEHTKDIYKYKINTPLPPEGEQVIQEEKPVSKKTPIDYQAVMSAYNSTLGDRLPQAEALNDKRRKAIKRLMTELKEPTIDAVENYFAAFAKNAKPFYFGENNTGWRASFDYLLKSDTLIKTREGSL
ncbi:TPA: replication protein [Escherichia coli]|uniref:replication protein n=1 Tax=Hafnia paralvei TaxID=546367 RepID=UPI001B1C01EA|nr:replication protein [Hafnia paralvei]MBU2672600.1 replication protein [Hafnia paralvei]HBA3651401.1 replication protein [Escherichia coli]